MEKWPTIISINLMFFLFFCKLTQHEIIKPNPKSKHVNLVQNQSATKTISANPTVPESDYPS